MIKTNEKTFRIENTMFITIPRKKDVMSFTRRQLLMMTGGGAGIALAGGISVYFITKAIRAKNAANLVLLQGKQATNFTLRDGNKISAQYDQSVSLNPYDGKVTLLNFWEIWCGYCMTELSDLGRLHDKYAGKVRVLGVNRHFEPNVSELQEMYESFNAQNTRAKKVKYPLLGFPSDLELKSQEAYSALRAKTQPIAQAYSMDSVPRTLIINSQGSIREDISGTTSFEQLEKLVKKYL